MLSVNIDIHSKIVKPKNLKKQNRDALLIEVQPKKQEKLKQIQKLAGLDVQVLYRKAFNYCKGKLVCRLIQTDRNPG